MKTRIKTLLACLVTLWPTLGLQQVEALTTAWWTVCTTRVQKTHVAHITIDNYFRLSHHRGENNEILPITIGLSYGLFNWNNVKSEIGVSYVAPTRYPVSFDTKVGIEEELLFPYSPGMSIGIFNVGTKTHGQYKTNQNIVDVCFSKSLPAAMLIGGTITVGGFGGNHAMGKNRLGAMVAYDREFCPAMDASDTEYNKWKFIADYATGKNTQGGGGFGVYYYFTPKIGLSTGPTWFNDQSIFGKWKWAIILQVDL